MASITVTELFLPSVLFVCLNKENMFPSQAAKYEGEFGVGLWSFFCLKLHGV